ncbi:MAG: tRNA glutamyl-Q(34) synthetase GluQRS [Pseudomonadota bacterium]
MSGVGRFAPSPTGDLHFGSLVSAIASYAAARGAGQEWFVRIEDVDRNRAVPGAADRIVAQLDAFGMVGDRAVPKQSERDERYAGVVAGLLASGDAFPCGCTRKDLPSSGIYPGTCAQGLPPGKEPRAVRLRVHDMTVAFEDMIQGPRSQRLAEDVGAFVIVRADGVYAYQLAVVIDDADQGVTAIVRGSDLLDSTPRQIYLQRLLGLPTPSYAHHPVAVDRDGRKLSKQWASAPVVATDPMPVLLRAWAFLGQERPPSSARSTPTAFWRWAVPAWALERVPCRETIPLRNDHEESA